MKKRVPEVKNGLINHLDGTKSWWLNDELHREDGPAIEYKDGTKCWYIHGKRHRVDGPAKEVCNGWKEWWFNGVRIELFSQDEFSRYLNLKSFL